MAIELNLALLIMKAHSETHRKVSAIEKDELLE